MRDGDHSEKALSLFLIVVLLVSIISFAASSSTLIPFSSFFGSSFPAFSAAAQEENNDTDGDSSSDPNDGGSGTEDTSSSPSESSTTEPNDSQEGEDEGRLNNGDQPNQPPIANAGEDIAVQEDQQVILNGEGSSDPDRGDQLTYHWRQVEPEAPLIELGEGVDAAKATFTAPQIDVEELVFTFELTVSDGTLEAKDMVKVTVRNVLEEQAGSNENNNEEEQQDSTTSPSIRQSEGSTDAANNNTDTNTNQTENSTDPQSSLSSPTTTTDKDKKIKDKDSYRWSWNGGNCFEPGCKAHVYLTADHVEPYFTITSDGLSLYGVRYNFQYTMEGDLKYGDGGILIPTGTWQVACQSTYERQDYDNDPNTPDPIQTSSWEYNSPTEAYTENGGVEPYVTGKFVHMFDSQDIREEFNDASATLVDKGGISCQTFIQEGSPLERGPEEGSWTSSGTISSSNYPESGNSISWRYVEFPNPDFEVTCLDPITAIAPSETVERTCTVDSINGFHDPVELFCTPPLNSGLSCLLAPNPVTPPPDGQVAFTVKVTASSTAAPGTSSLLITGRSIPSSGSPAITDSTNLPVTVTAPKVEIILDKSEIRPKIGQVTFRSANIDFTPGDEVTNNWVQPAINGGEVTVTVKVTGLSKVSGITVTLNFEPEPRTGAHNHLTTPTDRTAKQAFGGLKLPTEADSTLRVTTIKGTTDANGEFKVVFKATNLNTASASSAAGDIKFKATATLPITKKTINSPDKPLTIRIPGLVALTDGVNYDLIGHTSPLGLNHNVAPTGTSDSHYATPDVINLLTQIADEYARLHPGTVLQYNDISLPNGGLFDINADWNPAPPPRRDGHDSHACGVDVDMHNGGIALGTPEYEDLVNTVRSLTANGFVYNEGNHYHLHLMDCP